MPSMILFANTASPFARKVVVMLHETGLAGQVEVVNVPHSPVTPHGEVLGSNPAGKIPALRLASAEVLHDSRVILEYLDQLHEGEPLYPQGPQRWRRLTLGSLADALLDAAVLTRYETFLRPEEKRWDDWIAAQAGKIERGLAHFESASDELAERFDSVAIGLACALGYLDFRQLGQGWRERYPRLATWYARVSQRPSLLASEPA